MARVLKVPFYMEDGDRERIFNIKCRLYEGSMGTLEDPPEPAEVEIEEIKEDSAVIDESVLQAIDPKWETKVKEAAFELASEEDAERKGEFR